MGRSAGVEGAEQEAGEVDVGGADSTGASVVVVVVVVAGPGADVARATLREERLLGTDGLGRNAAAPCLAG